MQVGAHVSMSSSKTASDEETPPHGNVANAVFRQVAVGGNCGQIFTTSPQVWRDPDISDEEAELFREETAGKLDGPWVIHTSYLVNLCTPKDGLRSKSLASMQTEVDMADKLGIPYVNVHLGAHTGAGEQQGLDNAVSVLDDIDVPDGVTILLESDAGSGTKMGDDFAHLGYVLEHSAQDLDICLDTAHAFAAGYDLSTPEGVAETFEQLDEEVGLEHLKCVHLNDSKHACGTNKDEHAHIGEGLIGEDGMRAFVNHPAIVDNDVPLVLETPTEDGKSYAWNIERVRQYRADAN
ncbi:MULTISPECIES: deoxyribonuclease IV [Haloferax]|uniref:Probable endonuclease 4 n=1 Tax=Haloferax marinum TaxID=2666143 RepID=A0A6A8G668_9EURY|nr:MULTISPECIES: deoxyribonuclease IV [Haloferax]KAB1197197.1 deoxyribonuclease IV [Haloferax sp. CBA1150]MRW96235.1 deoxyribonuclease IV [Haloferax marinum]